MRVHTNLVILITVAVLVVGAAYADEFHYVVKPSNMNGWVLATLSSASPIPGYPGISTGFVGPSPRTCPAPNTLPGAFYADLGTEGSTSYGLVPGQVWLGTNKYNGTAIEDITDMVYYTWTTNSGIYAANKRQWACPRQPFGLRIVIKEADPSTVTHMLIYRPNPASSGGQPGFGFPNYPEDTSYVETWKKWEPMASGGMWAEFTYGAPTTSCLWTGNWDAVLAKYPGATITQPALQVNDATGGCWPESQPVDTPNACGVSLQWGAEARGAPAPGNTWPYQPWLNWWRETWDGCAFVDDFEFGVGDNYDSFDFEPDIQSHLVASSSKGMQDSTAGKAPYYSHLNMEFRAFGKVISKPLSYWYDVTQTIASPNSKEFVLDDGGIQIRVFCPGNSVAVGQWYAVTGKLMPAYGLHVQGDPREMRLHATTADLERNTDAE